MVGGSTGPGDERREALAVVDLAVAAARAYDRPDLASALGATRRRLAAPGARVVVVGDVKQGRSSLVDALVGTTACPVRDDVATRLTTVVHHAAGPSAVLVGEDARTAVDGDGLAEAVLAGDPRWSHAEVGLPEGLVADGLALVDTPAGVGPAARAEIAGADAVVLASDASRELTPAELDLLAEAAGHGAVTLLALTRADLHPRWREVRDLDRRRLAERGLDVDVLPVAAAVAERALRTADPDDAAALAAESGVPALADLLRRRVADPSGARTAWAALDEVADATGGMRAALDAERSALDDPEHAAALAADLTAAREQAARLSERTARWQQTLADGVGDLVSDIDWDLRDRMRHLVRDAEEILEAGDPATTWDTFAPWFTDQVDEAVTTTFVWAGERTWRLAERVADHFAETGDDVRRQLARRPRDVPAPVPAQVPADEWGPVVGEGDGAPDAPDAVGHEVAVPGGGAIAAELPALGELDTPDLERIGLAHGLVVGMRGSYGGVLMVGMVTTLSGLALINPLSIGAGVLLGGKTVRDERKRALERRRADALAAVRRYADEVLHLAGKRSRDMLREVQRTLRDHFTARAETLTRSVADAVTAAAAAHEIAAAARDRRLRDLRAEIARLDALAERAAACRAAVAASVPADARRPGRHARVAA